MAEETDLKPLVYHYLLANGWAKAAKALAKETGTVSTGECFVGSPKASPARRVSCSRVDQRY
jgi:hypothetical protein|eukprot:SAG25_NODE_1344_length_3251_cov_3.973985_2_plen_62_part_00